MYIVKWSDDEDRDQVAKFDTYEEAETWIKGKEVMERYEPTGFECESPEKVENEDESMGEDCMLPKKKMLEREDDKTEMTLLFDGEEDEDELNMFLKAATDHITGLRFEVLGDDGEGHTQVKFEGTVKALKQMFAEYMNRDSFTQLNAEAKDLFNFV